MTTEPIKPADAAQPPLPAAPTKAGPKKAPTKKKAPPRRKRAARVKKAPAVIAKSKSEIILTLVGRKTGATLAAIMKATDWQAHSIRGFISLAQSRRGLNIKSARNDAGERIYRIVTRKGK
jgi:hypothetical protein